MRKGQRGDEIRILICEGEHDDPDLNREVGAIIIDATAIGADLPRGSKVSVSMGFDSATREVRATAWVHALEQEITAHVPPTSTDVVGDELGRDLAALVDRVAALEQVAAEDPDVRHVLSEVQEGDLLAEPGRLIAEGKADPDALQEAERRIRDLKVLINPALAAARERDLWRWVAVKQECEENVDKARGIMSRQRHKTSKAQEREFDQLVAAYQQAVARQDADEAEKLAFSEIPSFLEANDLATTVGREETADSTMPDALQKRRSDVDLA